VTSAGTTCVATDEQGGTFSSTNSGATWSEPFDTKGKLTSVSCASAALCAEPTTGGDIAKLDPVP
jgi:hypothetical protein